MLAIGDPAPDFTLPDQDERPFTLSDQLAAGPQLLYFYPADFTPGCTREASAFQDLGQDLHTAGLRVVGISPQSPDSHRRFRAALSLEFPLLADPDKRVIRAYDADGPLGIGVRRITYSIGTDATILDAVLADLRIGRHAALVREAIERAPGTPEPD
jgi:thioredoxin-dependent peroxiredoxin